MPTPIPRWQQFIGMGKESTWNTPVAAATFFPITASDHTPQFEDIPDDSYRGNAAQEQAYYQGVGWTDLNWPNMNFYPDDSGNLFMAMLGTDTVTGVARTGTIAAASAGATSLTYTVSTGGSPVIGDIFGIDAGTATAEQIGGIYWEELDLKFVNPGRLTVDIKGKGTIQGTVTKPSNTYSSQKILLPWQGTLTLGGSTNAK